MRSPFNLLQLQFPQPLLIRLVFWSFHQLCCLSLHMLEQRNSLLLVRGPKLNAIFKVRSHQCDVQGISHFSSPAGHISHAGQDAIGLLAMWAHCYSSSVSCQLAAPGPFPPGNFAATLLQGYAVALGWCDPSVGPSTEPYWMSCNWTWPIDLSYPDVFVKSSYHQAGDNSLAVTLILLGQKPQFLWVFCK